MTTGSTGRPAPDHAPGARPAPGAPEPTPTRPDARTSHVAVAGAAPAVLAERARSLRALHRPGQPLLLPNAWDAGSARLVVAAGFPAVATSSAAVADALGDVDGEATPVGEMLDAVARVARSVAVPVTADVERGYGLRPAELVERLVAAGVAGANLEDSEPVGTAMVEPERQADFLAELRAAAHATGVPLVLNARVDTFLHGAGGPQQRLADAVQRGRRYLAAGADCAYPILAPADAVAPLVQGIAGPVNILYRPAGPSFTRLAELGVARISFGSGLYTWAQALLRAELARIQAQANPRAATAQPG